MKFTLPKIYPITDTRISGLSHLEQVRRLIAGGARMIQLRENSSTAGEFYRAAVETVDYARRQGVRIIVNDRTDIALACGADGAHLGQNDLAPEHARALLGSEAIIGFSTHSIDQARDALTMPVDYLAIGPIFATSTKENPDPVVGLEGVRAVRQLAGDFPIVAIGGIDRRNAAAVLGAGADCVAMISDIVSEPSTITARMQELSQV
ncbi:MAG: thiamine phosphate synthase [Acidobacteriota bacterium]